MLLDPANPKYVHEVQHCIEDRWTADLTLDALTWQLSVWNQNTPSSSKGMLLAAIVYVKQKLQSSN